jgi:hypothetical protein
MLAPAKIKPKCHPPIPLKPCNIAVVPGEKITDTIWETIDDAKI